MGKLFFTFIFIFSGVVSSHANLRCDAFLERVEDPFMDTSQIRNPYDIGDLAEAQTSFRLDPTLNPEQPPPHISRSKKVKGVRLSEYALEYFKERNPEWGLRDVETWLNDLKAADRDALDVLAHLRKRSDHLSAVFENLGHYKELLARVQKLTFEELSDFSPRVQIDLFRLFSSWHLIPVNSFMESWQRAAILSLRTWHEQDFRRFAILKKSFPDLFSEAFKAEYRDRLVGYFRNFKPDIQIKVFSSEMLSDLAYPGRQREILISSVHLALDKLSTNKVWMKKWGPIDLVQVAEALHQVKILRPEAFDNRFASLLARIEDLVPGLTQGESYKNAAQREKNLFVRGRDTGVIDAFLRERFPESKVIQEHQDLSLGIFRPADRFISDFNLVVEIDGRHHYYWHLNELGLRVKESQARPLLRTVDVMRMQVMKKTGRIETIRVRAFGKGPNLSRLFSSIAAKTDSND